jgi:hypothetical protein
MNHNQAPQPEDPEIKHRLLKGVLTVGFFAFLMWLGVRMRGGQ